MEIGAFILALVLIVVVVGALVLFGIAGRLRREKLDPQEDKLAEAQDRQLARAQGRDRTSDDGRDGGDGAAARRPRHVRVRSGQRSRFLSS
jgi:hypothetical protein